MNKFKRFALIDVRQKLYSLHTKWNSFTKYMYMMTIHRQQTMQGKLSAQKSSLHQHKGKIRLSILVHVKATYLGPSVYSSSIWVCALYFEEHTCRQLHTDIFVQVSPTPSHKLTVTHILLEKERERKKCRKLQQIGFTLFWTIFHWWFDFFSKLWMNVPLLPSLLVPFPCLIYHVNWTKVYL